VKQKLAKLFQHKNNKDYYKTSQSCYALKINYFGTMRKHGSNLNIKLCIKKHEKLGVNMHNFLTKQKNKKTT
jgi:hypothetical protein